jgi:hypothetical protein
VLQSRKLSTILFRLKGELEELRRSLEGKDKTLNWAQLLCIELKKDNFRSTLRMLRCDALPCLGFLLGFLFVGPAEGRRFWNSMESKLRKPVEA